MSHFSRTLSLIAAAMLLISGCTATGASPSDLGTADPTIFLVRHAEKQKGPDPSLTEAGAARAERIADQLENADIEKIYSTDTKRTRETAAPLAGRLGLEVVLYDPFDLPGFADHLKTEGLTVLVVGHSNTTPGLATLLTGEEGTPIDESNYERLYCLEGTQTVILVAGGDALAQPGCP